MDNEMFQADSLQDRLAPYRLSSKEILYGLIVLLAVGVCAWLAVMGILATGEDSALRGWATLALASSAAWLGFATYKARGLFLELKALRDVYETLRLAQEFDLPPDDVLDGLRLLRFKGFSDAFIAPSQNPMLRGVIKAVEEANPRTTLVVGDARYDDIRLHRIYKSAFEKRVGGISVVQDEGGRRLYDVQLVLRCAVEKGSETA